MPQTVIRPKTGSMIPSPKTIGLKTIAMPPATASALARHTRAAVTGAEAIRSGASSPEMASQASPPANCPAAMISTGTSNAAPGPSS